MRSTGEVMGIDRTFGLAFFKAEIAAGTDLPAAGMVFLSLADRDKAAGLVAAEPLRELGLGDRRDPGHRGDSWSPSCARRPVVEKVSARAPATAVDLDGSAARSPSSSTRRRAAARGPTARSIRRAAHAAPCPRVTTVAGGPRRGAAG